jgi:site-specific DNA-adenine methylase
VVFLFAGGGATLIALATISIQSIKAALANPVKSLKKRIPRVKNKKRNSLITYNQYHDKKLYKNCLEEPDQEQGFLANQHFGAYHRDDLYHLHFFMGEG